MIKQIKIGVFTFLFVLTLAMYTGCNSDNSVYIEETTGTDEIQSYADDKPVVDSQNDWKTAYKNYIATYSPEMGYATLGFVDFNTDGQPELIILDDSQGTLRGRFIIISYQNGEAVEIGTFGTTASITEVEGQFYFYRNFNSIHDSGGMYGYGFVSKLECNNEIFSITNLLESHIDYNYDFNLDELSWQLEGEESILKSDDFTNYLTIQKWINDI